jgi:hypothetical protein
VSAASPVYLPWRTQRHKRPGRSISYLIFTHPRGVRCFPGADARMAPFATKMMPLARRAGCARRALSTATLGRTAATLGRETDAADFWRRSQDGVVLPELSAQLEAARRGSYESRSALATALSKRWTVDQVSAQKMQESHVMAAYALRVEGVDLGLMRAAIWPSSMTQDVRHTHRAPTPPSRQQAGRALLSATHCTHV